MHEIRKPKRTAGKIVRSRNKGTDDNKCKNSQGLREECDPKYARVVSFQRAVSIRRAELADLVGMDLIYMGEDWSVLVRHGKGGKTQLQRILPQDVDTVREIFDGIEDTEKVFSKEELNNKIDSRYAGRKCQKMLRILCGKDRSRAEICRTNEAQADGSLA